MTLDYRSILARKTLRGLPPSGALLTVAHLIDGAHAHRDVGGTRKAIGWCSDLRKPKWWKRLSAKQKGELHYFESNAWGDLEGHIKRGNPEEWDWAQEEITKQTLCLRSALLPEAFNAQGSFMQCQILTNLANTLDRIGRTVEALEYWSRAIEIDPNFGMALGNRGKGVYAYASLLYDPNHQVILLRHSRNDLSLALSQDLDDVARRSFVALKETVDAILAASDPGRKTRWDHCTLGRSRRERGYRRWCLKHGLFLNPLNDIQARPLAARDVLCMPSLTTSRRAAPPPQIGLFNNLKQEYVSARYLYFEGTHHERSHFSDRNVLLMNTLDYPSYGIGREQVKAAYRMAYSILDKVGYLLNDYVGFGIRPKDVSFRTMWFVRQEESEGLVDLVQRRPNLPMRGLYWISRDLFDARSGLKSSTEPDALQLQQIRNHIEHRYLKVHEDMWAGPDLENPFTDTLAVSIYRDDLEAKALRMLRFARAALVYVVCAVQVEELERANKASKGFIAPMFVDRWEDDWKV